MILANHLQCLETNPIDFFLLFFSFFLTFLYLKKLFSFSFLINFTFHWEFLIHITNNLIHSFLFLIFSIFFASAYSLAVLIDFILVHFLSFQYITSFHPTVHSSGSSNLLRLHIRFLLFTSAIDVFVFKQRTTVLTWWRKRIIFCSETNVMLIHIYSYVLLQRFSILCRDVLHDIDISK